MTTTHKKAAQARSEYPNTIFEVWPMIIFASRKPGLQMCRVRFGPLEWGGCGERWELTGLGKTGILEKGGLPLREEHPRRGSIRAVGRH